VPRENTATEPLGIGLEGWRYPAPVVFLPLVMGGEPVRMAYMDIAPTATANGRAILLLHGKNFDGSYWAGPIAWLTAAGFRVIVPDQIGFNKSSKPDVDYTFEGLARNTMALADALSLGRFAVLGHSTGGALAVRLASMVPERVEQLILEDPIGLVDYRAYIAPQETATLVAAEHAYTVQSYRAFVAHFFQILPPAAYEPFVTWRMRTTLSSEFDRFARASALTYQMIYREPVRSLYPALTMPVLLTAGTKDRSAPLIGYATPAAKARMPGIHDAAQQAMADLPAGRFVSFPGVGHIPHLEMPDRFRAALLAFLANTGF
jgi:pimeloyl-ACP methyl ester carboxylesterase